MDEDVDSDRDDDDYDVRFASGFRGVVNDGEDDEEDKNDDDDDDPSSYAQDPLQHLGQERLVLLSSKSAEC